MEGSRWFHYTKHRVESNEHGDVKYPVHLTEFFTISHHVSEQVTCAKEDGQNNEIVEENHQKWSFLLEISDFVDYECDFYIKKRFC